MASDLIVLSADKSMQQVIKVLLSRYQALGLARPVRAEILVHPQHDDGCLLGAERMLAAFVKQFHHSMVMFDHQGCGQENVDPQALEAQVEQRLAGVGWGDRCATMVIAPELENWVWSESPHVTQVLGWSDPATSVWSWLAAQGFSGRPKPEEPKEALRSALRKTRKSFSAAIHAEIADRVSLSACTDRAFLKFRQRLQDWFG